MAAIYDSNKQLIWDATPSQSRFRVSTEVSGASDVGLSVNSVMAGGASITAVGHIGIGSSGDFETMMFSDGRISGSAGLQMGGDAEIYGTAEITGRGHFLGLGTDPGAAISATGSLKLSGSFSTGYVCVRDAYYEIATRSQYDCVIGVSSSNTTAVQVMLPSASIGAGHRIIIKDEFWPGDGGTRAAQYAITASVSGGSGDLVDGLDDYEMYGSMPSVTFYSDGISKWFVI